VGDRFSITDPARPNELTRRSQNSLTCERHSLLRSVRLAALWFLMVVGCGEDRAGTEDCAPTTISDVAAQATHTTGIRLNWTAPSANRVAVERYVVRYSSDSSLVTESPPVEQRLLVPPLNPGQLESLEILGLIPGTQYFFVLQSVSDEGCPSKVSPIVCATTFAGTDSLPPLAPDAVEVLTSTVRSVVLRWSHSGDDGLWGLPVTYEIGIAESPFDSSTWTQVSKHVVPAEAVGEPKQSYEVGGLHWSRRYYFAVRAYDEQGNASALSMLANKTTTARTLIVDQATGEYTKIQLAVDAADPLDTVLVAPGIYNESVQVSDKGVILVSRDGPATTIIDASGLNRPVLALESVHSELMVVKGFTIQNGHATNIPDPTANPVGGAIALRRGRAEICGNIVQDNRSDGILASHGGGISAGSPVPFADAAFVTICHNEIRRNSATSNGGGIAIIEMASATIRDNVFSENQSGSDGGAVWIWTRSGQFEIESNKFTRNRAGDHGGGVYVSNRAGLQETTVNIANNLFDSNTAVGKRPIETASGGGLWGGRLSGLIENNTFAFNVAPGESNVDGGGLALVSPSPSLTVSRNVFFKNVGSGLACRRQPNALLSGNISWLNTPTAIAVDGECPSSWTEGFQELDPEFCSDSNLVPGATSNARRLGAGAFLDSTCTPFAPPSTQW